MKPTKMKRPILNKLQFKLKSIKNNLQFRRINLNRFLLRLTISIKKQKYNLRKLLLKRLKLKKHQWKFMRITKNPQLNRFTMLKPRLNKSKLKKPLWKFLNRLTDITQLPL